MPQVEVSHGVQLYYEIGLCESETLSHSEMPWLLTVHPLYQDGYCIKHNTEDKLVKSRFNRITFDLRYHGRSTCSAVPAFDMYTLAADIAFGLDKLNIPPVHGLALHPWASEILLRLAIVFRDKVLSVCFCSMPPQQDDDFTKRAFQECFQYWAYPEAPEDWDEAISSTLWWHFGPESEFDADVLDEWAGILLRRFPPSKAVQQVMVAMPYLKRDVISKATYATLRQPALFIRGASDAVYTLAETADRLNALPPHPAHDLRTIEGGPLMFCRTHPIELRDNYLEWVDKVMKDHLLAKNQHRKTHWQSSLDMLAAIVGDESIGLRDATKSSSYYALDEDSVREIGALLDQQRARQDSTFSFIGGGGPEVWSGASFDEVFPWKFSSRFNNARIGGSAGARIEPLSLSDSAGTLIKVEYEKRNVTIEQIDEPNLGEDEEVKG